MILHILLGDQLDRDSAIFQHFDPACDLLWMAEVREESTHVWSHKVRSALFLSAMRHFRDELHARGLPLHYSTLHDNPAGFRQALERDLAALRPSTLRVIEPGDFRVTTLLREAAATAGSALHILPDTHFICSTERFQRHARGRSSLRMEYFYREMRRETGLLLQPDGSPEGGDWNYDAANRRPFPASGPGPLPASIAFPPDELTRAVFRDIETYFPDHPGDLDTFDWPVTPADAERALQDFLQHKLPHFGDHQDAMWAGQPYLYHARLSAALNLKLLNPLHVCREAERAWRTAPDHIPLSSVEGFIRQILGWREYVRGVYHLHMPGYLDQNALDAQLPLPSFYWTGDTDMACLRDVLTQTLRLGYAHHIQRLMVTGLFSLLLGVDPRAIHEWFLATHLDAVEWAELPNTLGMSQYADGGIMASKPYVATGAYLHRMSNYCASCRFRPDRREGPDACPFTTLYWDFLARHRDSLARNPRMSLQLRNLNRIPPPQLADIRQHAQELRDHLFPTIS